MAVIIECDRCKTTVRGKDGYETFNVGSEKSPGGCNIHGHLCRECAVEVIRFINKRPMAQKG
jgi:hypothetical protein